MSLDNREAMTVSCIYVVDCKPTMQKNFTPIPGESFKQSIYGHFNSTQLLLVYPRSCQVAALLLYFVCMKNTCVCGFALMPACEARHTYSTCMH